ncbi:arabinan endo-1,5-alpha-L-arabinosidase [Pedobacter antarcticus]|uniref:Arabinan endo-1,5-alpha-L-arabinosidase n=1 Tax=Pedobacter antarcticus TaxID=34086 RepID=A0A1I2D325_9SPHI|nr:arabinan endo-1,5-alpha-L-arabinosidase [Pedobacter antarcticus]SDM71490.1 arabinan endo-1,5-alpha-L-arabinosidase [Pedobacter antarcticus]SFE74911.1 arabinan endo-1,5-alpha-L-arabinosidase [Pedobacter antarcticus]
MIIYKRIRNLFFLLILVSTSLKSLAQQPAGQISVHDPVMIKAAGTYYLFSTGMGISVWTSPDLKNWKPGTPVFSAGPVWAEQSIPGFKGHIWAPDIVYKNNRYYLYYSVSAFGKNTSAIGVATNPTLDQSSPTYLWTDHGEVIRSIPGETNWNAIDPNIITDEKGQSWMAFGSFWDGLKLIRMSADLLRTEGDIRQMPTIASRKEDPDSANPPALEGLPQDAGGNSIEAPFLYKKNGFYYLFASVDYCCQGVKSTYKMIVGRSKTVEGPYLDKQGKAMNRGGGSLLLEGDQNWYGTGHNAVANFDGTDYLIFHGYDAHDQGKPKLRLEKLDWPGGWPAVRK